MVIGRVNRDWFYKLASDLEDERVSSAVALIKDLAALELPRDAEEWSYVLKRLVGGLASGRNSARLGFSLCLTEVINLALSIEDEAAKPQELATITKFFDVLSEHLAIDGSATGENASGKVLKGKDERGLLFGKMFALQALLNEPVFSQIFIEDGRVSGFAIRFIDELAQLATLKAWLREPCLFTLFGTIEKLLPFMNSNGIRSILQLFDKYQLTLTNEGLAIYLSLLKNAPNETASACSDLKLNSKCWKANDPLARGNLPLLSQVLRNSGASQEAPDSPTTKNTNWNPRLHFIWDILLPIIASPAAIDEPASDRPPSKKRRKEKSSVVEFPEFWKAAVDETFFNDKASSERKYLGFLIFEKTLDFVSPSWLHCCFSQNFMRCLINQSSNSKRLLYKMSQNSLRKVVNICGDNPSEKLIPCLESILFGSNGSINFDKLTKSKTVSKLISLNNITGNCLSSLFECLASQLSDISKMQKNEVQFSLDTLLHIIRSHKSKINDQLSLKPLLKPIVMCGFFLKGNEYINRIARDRLYSVLSELTTVENKGHSWQFQALEIILEEESSKRELANPLDESLLAIKNDSLVVLKKVSNDLANPQSRGLECLLSMCILEMYAGESESISIIEELCAFYNELQIEKSTSLVGLTEILLSLLAQRKSLFRKLSLLVWQQFINVVGEDELKVLLDVLSARENKKGFSQLFEDTDEQDEDDAEAEESQMEDEDRGEADLEENDRSDEELSASGSDSDSGESNDEGDDDVAEIDKEATSALAKALNIPENMLNDKGEVDFNQMDDESGDDSDEDEIESMDDEMMMQLDGQLSEIFKRRKEALTSVNTGNDRKIEAKESREDVITFKNRIIDMLEIYIKNVEKRIPSNDSTPAALNNLLLFIEPMINCIRETVDQPLALRISKLLKTRIYKIKPSEFQPAIEDSKKLYMMLEATHLRLLAVKSGLHKVIYHSVCATTSLFLAKILIGTRNDEQPGEVCDKIIDLYTTTLKQWKNHGKFGPNLFIDLVNWLASRK